MKSIFNTALRALSSTSKTKVKTDIINEFLFTDDCALNAIIKANMQNCVDKFSMACDNFGLIISPKKTEVMHQPAPGKPYVEPNITIKGQHLKVVETFTYLGNTHSKSIVMDDEMNPRLAKVSTAFGQLNRNVWNHRGILEVAKINVYRAIILTTLVYGSKMWTTYQWHIKKLNHFQTTCLRRIRSIAQQKHIPNTEILSRASLPSIYTILMQSQLC